MSDQLAALRQLRDCGVIRVRFDSAPLQALWALGLATEHPADDDEEALGYRLTAQGRPLAKEVLK
jgi:hypothetical protein